MLLLLLVLGIAIPVSSQVLEERYQGPKCLPLKVPADVSVIPPTCATDSMKAGARCSFRCKPHYRVHGPPERQCTDTGQWTFAHFNVSCRDLNECKVHNGGCSHKCVNTDGGYRCECPKYLKLDKDRHRCKAEGLHLTCGLHDMKLEVPKVLIHNLHHRHLSLNDPKCGATSNATHYIMRTSHTGCGTTSREIRGFITYSNKVSEAADKDSSKIARVLPGEVQIPFCCYYHNKETVHAVGFGPRSRELYIKVKGRGKLKLKLDFYKTKNFQSTYTWEDFPVAAHVRQRLYFEVSLETKEKDLEVFADNCCSTPTRDHEQSRYLRHTFLHNGCPVDKTVQFHKSPIKTSERFSLEAFKFLGDHPFVFIHCHVIVCDAKDPNSRCSKGCMPGNRRIPAKAPLRKLAAIVKAKAHAHKAKHAAVVKAKAHAHKAKHGKHKRDVGAVTLAEMPAVTLSQGPFLFDEKAETYDKRAKIPNRSEDEGEPARSVNNKPEEKKPESGISMVSSVLLVAMTVASVMALMGVMYMGYHARRVRPIGYYQVNTKSDKL